MSAIINEQIRINEYGGKISCLLHEKCKYCGKIFHLNYGGKMQFKKAEQACSLIGEIKV